LTKSLRHIQQTLHAAGIESAAIGGMAVAVWGEPRATRDVDLKIQLDRDRAAKLIEILGDAYPLVR
jgi:hypothetical protein